MALMLISRQAMPAVHRIYFNSFIAAQDNTGIGETPPRYCRRGQTIYLEPPAEALSFGGTHKGEAVMIDFLIRQARIFVDIFAYLIPAMPTTLAITVVAFICAVFLGLIVSLARLSGIVWLRRLAKAYVDILRGVPLLVQIFFIYFGLGKVFHLSRFAAGVLAIGICYSAYLAEIFRSGIAAIEKGQHEAALSLGMTRSPGERG